MELPAYKTLIDTETLERSLKDPALAVVDCRFKLDEAAWGEQQYQARHIPGAVFAHLDRDLSGPKTGTNGRHPLPDPATFANTLSRLGIDSNVQVVVYDQDAGMYASRLWWLLRWMGHDKVAVVDGGFAKWTAEGRQTASGHEIRPPGQFAGTPDLSAIADANEVSRLIHNPQWRLVDARAPERYRGDVEPIDRVAGHIPTATNHFFKNNLSEQGTFLPPGELGERLTASLAGVRPDRVVCYCGSGVTACHDLLALEHAGMPGAKLYPGSWSEWSSDPERPIEKNS